ncbi:MAG: hypothetical protein ACFFD4_29770, partial [Candidatus Odinarchaeota archaeon]
MSSKRNLSVLTACFLLLLVTPVNAEEQLLTGLEYGIKEGDSKSYVVTAFHAEPERGMNPKLDWFVFGSDMFGYTADWQPNVQVQLGDTFSVSIDSIYNNKTLTYHIDLDNKTSRTVYYPLSPSTYPSPVTEASYSLPFWYQFVTTTNITHLSVLNELLYGGSPHIDSKDGLITLNMTSIATPPDGSVTAMMKTSVYDQYTGWAIMMQEKWWNATRLEEWWNVSHVLYDFRIDEVENGNYVISSADLTLVVGTLVTFALVMMFRKKRSHWQLVT